jgi:sterol O-acyltransferase
MLKISHFQTIYNIFIAVFLLSFANTLLHNFYENGSPIDFSLLFWCFSKFPEALIVWVGLMLVSFSAYGIQVGLVTRTLSPFVAYTLHAIIVIVKHLTVSIVVRTREYPVATAAFVMCEAVRLTMKMHSYLMVNRLLR